MNIVLWFTVCSWLNLQIRRADCGTWTSQILVSVAGPGTNGPWIHRVDCSFRRFRIPETRATQWVQTSRFGLTVLLTNYKVNKQFPHVLHILILASQIGIGRGNLVNSVNVFHWTWIYVTTGSSHSSFWVSSDTIFLDSFFGFCLEIMLSHSLLQI